MIFGKNKNSMTNVGEIDSIEIPELEKILYYLIGYKQLVESIRLFNVNLSTDIRSGMFYDFDGNINELMFDLLKESVEEITISFERLFSNPYKLAERYNSLLNQKNKVHFIHLSEVTIKDVKASVSNLNVFLEEYIKIINKIIFTQNFNLHNQIKMGDLMKKIDFLESNIEEIENYFKLVKNKY